MKKNLVVALFCTFFSMTIFAQPKKIKLENPSFEDYPQPGSAPMSFGIYLVGFFIIIGGVASLTIACARRASRAAS